MLLLYLLVFIYFNNYFSLYQQFRKPFPKIQKFQKLEEGSDHQIAEEEESQRMQELERHKLYSQL